MQCGTCQHVHTLRIGLGQEEKQRHKFNCRGCSEQIEVGLDLNFTTVDMHFYLGENAEPTTSKVEGSIVILDPNFLVPSSAQGKSDSFPRLEQSSAFLKARWGAGPPRNDTGVASGRPNYGEEWALLRKGWSLYRTGNENLVSRRVREISREKYKEEPLSGIADWVWRFSQSISAPVYEEKLVLVLDEINRVVKEARFERFIEHYKTNMAPARGAKYFSLYKEYFSAYAEFSQVHFWVTSGLDVSDDQQASSSDFDMTKMFYGNAFEAYTSMADVMAYINNVVCGRDFDKFERLSMDEYSKLDKRSRLKPIISNPMFSLFGEEVDNNLRNASHHGGFMFEHDAQIIRYKSGKGGGGADAQISYAKYLEKCAKVFLQAVMLLRLELILSAGFQFSPPL